MIQNQDKLLIACGVPAFLSARQSVLAKAVLRMFSYFNCLAEFALTGEPVYRTAADVMEVAAC
jgi:hypothetical protein